ncbi:hypothetical protein D1872_328510 [compost metagenome]
MCSVRQAHDAVLGRVGGKPAEYVQARSGDHLWWVTDTQKLRLRTGWFPKVSLAEIVDQLCVAEEVG